MCNNIYIKVCRNHQHQSRSHVDVNMLRVFVSSNQLFFFSFVCGLCVFLYVSRKKGESGKKKGLCVVKSRGWEFGVQPAVNISLFYIAELNYAHNLTRESFIWCIHLGVVLYLVEWEPSSWSLFIFSLSLFFFLQSKRGIKCVAPVCLIRFCFLSTPLGVVDDATLLFCFFLFSTRIGNGTKSWGFFLIERLLKSSVKSMLTHLQTRNPSERTEAGCNFSFKLLLFGGWCSPFSFKLSIRFYLLFTCCVRARGEKVTVFQCCTHVSTSFWCYYFIPINLPWRPIYFHWNYGQMFYCYLSRNH